MTMKATSHLSISISMDCTSMAASTTPMGPKIATASTALASKAPLRMKVPAEKTLSTAVDPIMMGKAASGFIPSR